MNKNTAKNIIKHVLIPQVQFQIKHNEESQEKFKENKEIYAYHLGCLDILKQELETLQKLMAGLERKGD